MNIASAERVAPGSASPSTRSSLRYIWVHVVVAALAMVATMPGRTHGLGLITKPLMENLKVGEVQYASINLWGTLLGAIFCVPCGWLLDRFGPRVVLTMVSALLGLVVIVMSQIQPDWWVGELILPWMPAAIPFAFGLFVLVLLTRGLGQSALSVASLALMGKSAGRNSQLAYGIYSFVVAVGFMAAFILAGLVQEAEWRLLWAGMGWSLIGFAIAVPFIVQSSFLVKSEPAASGTSAPAEGQTLSQALLTRTFWVFALAMSLYGMIYSGLVLFNQLILEERGFDRKLYTYISAVMPLVGLVANLATGWMATRVPLGRLLAVSMIILGAALYLFPYVQEIYQVYLYATAMGIAGGMITVLFFAVWGKAFGTAQLGSIQGAAQMITVFASALGPLLVAFSHDALMTYAPFFELMAPACGLFGLIAWYTRAGEQSVPRADLNLFKAAEDAMA